MSTSSTSPGSPPSLAPPTNAGGASSATAAAGAASSSANAHGNIDTEDPLATALRSLLDPTIRLTTEKLLVVQQSQTALTEELDKLIAQLTNYLETTDPPALKPTIIKLASVGKRLAAVNNSLQAIQTRVNKLFTQLSKQRAVNPS